MTSLVEECPSATHFLFIAASGGRGQHRDRTTFAWQVKNRDGEPVGSGNSTLSAPIRDQQQRALLPIMIEAIEQGNIPTDSHLHLIAMDDWIADLLNAGLDKLHEDGYRRRSGHGFLEGKHRWQQLRAASRKRNVRISGDRPKSRTGTRASNAVTYIAVKLGENLDNPDDWTASVGTSAEINGGPTGEAEGAPTNAMPKLAADWRPTISNDIPPPVKPRPKMGTVRSRTRRKR